MTRHNDRNEQFEEISRQIADAEKDLRSRFEDTPRPSQDALMRIKVRLLTEMRQAPPIHGSRVHWLRWSAAVAAVLAVVAGARLYHQFRAGPVAGTGPGAAGQMPSSLEESLDIFASALPSALGDEDAALRQLSSDLKELETQTARSWDNIREPSGPTARQSDEPWNVASLAPAECGRAGDRPFPPPLRDWRNA